MGAIFDNESQSQKIGQHRLSVFSIANNERQNAISEIANIIPNHYIDFQELLQRHGKKKAADYLKDNILPTKLIIRSGDLGEILAAEYVKQETLYDIPINRLRYKDSREMPMHGDDIIGLIPSNERHPIKFLKGEAKSRKSLSSDVINEAQQTLEKENGSPTPYSLGFIADRLHELGNQELSDQIINTLIEEKILPSQVEHLIFTFSQNDPKKILSENLKNSQNSIQRNNIGLYVGQHQAFIESSYDNTCFDRQK